MGDAEDGWTEPPVENRRRALAVVFGIVFVDLLGFGILIPIVPLYASAFGASEFVVGVLIASYSMTQFLFAPILGRLSDERGRRPILLLSLFGSVVAWTLFGLAGGLAVLFLARLLAGAMGGNIATAHAYVADVMPPEKRARGLGLIGAAFGLGFVFGPALGGVFSAPSTVAAADRLLPAAVPITQFTLPSFVAAAVSLLNLLLAAMVLPETNEGTATITEEPSRVQRLLGALENPALRGLIVSFFLFSFAFSAMESMFVLFTRDLYGYGPTMNGYVLAYLGVVIAVVQGGVVGRVTERFGELTVAVVGVGVELVTLSSLPFSPVLGGFLPDIAVPGAGLTLSGGLLALLIVLTGLSIGNGFANVSLNALVSRSAAEDRQGGAFGLTQSAGSLARASGPVLAGLLYTAGGYWVPFVLAGVLMLPILAILLGVLERPSPVPS